MSVILLYSLAPRAFKSNYYSVIVVTVAPFHTVAMNRIPCAALWAVGDKIHIPRSVQRCVVKQSYEALAV